MFNGCAATVLLYGEWFFMAKGRLAGRAGAIDSYDYKFESRQFEIGKQTYWTQIKLELCFTLITSAS